jgi:hypothetical protein
MDWIPCWIATETRDTTKEAHKRKINIFYKGILALAADLKETQLYKL